MVECGKKCEVCIASEYAYSSVVGKNTCIIAISQSGETADTMSAVRFAKKKGARVIGITNVISSSLAREADECVSLNAGPEISVVATKTFMAQLAVLYKLAYEIGGKKDMIEKLKDVSHSIELALTKQGEIEKLAESLLQKQSFFYIGRGLFYPIALEGALKLKEITYLHAEGFAGGELKHGPLSLIEKGVPVIALAPNDETVHKMIGSIKECKARGAHVISISDSQEVKKESDECVMVDGVDASLFPFISICVLQLLAYYMAAKKELDPDKPRNLAKSVTVE